MHELLAVLSCLSSLMGWSIRVSENVLFESTVTQTDLASVRINLNEKLLKGLCSIVCKNPSTPYPCELEPVEVISTNLPTHHEDRSMELFGKEIHLPFLIESSSVT